jgi:cytochrome P450
MLFDPDFVPFRPPPRPLGLRGLPTIWRNYIETILQAAYQQGITRTRTRYSDVLLVCEPDVIGEILVEKADAFGRDPATRRSFKPVVGDNSIFVAKGAEWRWQRRAAAPIFRHETIASFLPVFAAMAERQVERWQAAPSDRPVDAAAAMTRTTFDIIVESMLGGSASLDADRYSRALTENFETIPWHLIYTMFAVPEWMPFPNRSRAMRSRDFLHRDMRRIIETRRANPLGQPDLLDQLLAARDPETCRGMSDAEVANNLLTFIAAGHETTAVALTWTLWLLAKDPASQQRAHDEVADVVGHGPVAAAHVEKLIFCRHVIFEAMRLYPAAPGIGRLPNEPMVLGGERIGVRTRIHIPIFALHRNTQLWENPDAFDPDRFAADKVKARSRYAFLPFGGGPRVCIGASFATIEAAVILAVLVRALHFRPVAGHKPKPVARVTLRPADGMPLLVTARARAPGAAGRAFSEARKAS